MVIGNGGGGKSTLARALSGAWDLPWIEVDRIQFAPGWVRVADDEVRSALAAVHRTERWLIDGFGPWDSIVERFARADTLIWVDHPLWVHFWWAAERQIAVALGQPRLGGPEGCDLSEVTRQMFEAIGRVHDELRPRLLDLVDRHREGRTVHEIRSPEALDAFIGAIRGPG